MRLGHRPTILKAGQVFFQDKSTPTGLAKTLRPGIQTIACQWLKDRFCPAGGTDRADIVLEHAAITQKGATKGTWFWRTVTYQTDLKIAIVLRTHGGDTKCTASAEATVHQTVSDNISFFQRCKIWTQMVEDALAAAEDELRKQLASQENCATALWDSKTAAHQSVTAGPIWSQGAVTCARTQPLQPRTGTKPRP